MGGCSSKEEHTLEVLEVETKSWHDTIIRTYENLIDKGLRLPKFSIRKTLALKKLRNEVHYEILGDLRMWRMFKDNRAYLRYLPTVVKTIEIAFDNLSKIKKVTTGSDERFRNLKGNLLKTPLVQQQNLKLNFVSRALM